MAKQVIELQPGESKAVTFEVTPTVAKTYQVSVDGLSGSFSAVAIEGYESAIGIWDKVSTDYVSGTIIIDGIEHFTDFRWEGPLSRGYHTFDLIVPSGYRFVRFEIYTFETGKIPRIIYSRPLRLEIDTRTAIWAAVRPT